MKNRVLIVDDEENIRRMMRLALEASGYEVEEAADGFRGLDSYGDGSKWSAVLLDERMPGMDGLETLRNLRSRDPEARIIMVTAYASVELAVDAMKAGATDFVRKPTTPDILRGAVQAALAKPAKKEAAPASAEEVSEPPQQIETITLNGFEIIRPEDMGALPHVAPNEREFKVRTPEGSEFSVVVKIDEEPGDYIERITGRRLPPNSSFWTFTAERLLSDYLWQKSAIPPTGRLHLKELDREQLLTAERWKD
jgi:FixJ family two-component response regulator